MELLKNSDEWKGGEHKIPSSCQLVFGTEKVYVFLRLYCALLGLFNSAKQSMESGSHMMDVDGTSSNTYHNYLSNLKDYINEDIQFKAYELRCRNLTQKKCYELSAIPRLIEKCADAIVKVAREDELLGLYDFYRLKSMDPVLQRAQSLSVCRQASYRIQYDPIDGKMLVCHLPKEKDMLTRPRNSNGTSTPNPKRPLVKEISNSYSENNVETEDNITGDKAEDGKIKRGPDSNDELNDKRAEKRSRLA